MARFRSLSPDIWRHPAFRVMPDAAQKMFLGLLNQADDDGLIECDPDILASFVWPGGIPSNIDTEAMVQEMNRTRIAQIYQADGVEYLAIPRFQAKPGEPRFPWSQIINRPTPSSRPAPGKPLVEPMQSTRLVKPIPPSRRPTKSPPSEPERPDITTPVAPSQPGGAVAEEKKTAPPPPLPLCILLDFSYTQMIRDAYPELKGFDLGDAVKPLCQSLRFLNKCDEETGGEQCKSAFKLACVRANSKQPDKFGLYLIEVVKNMVKQEQDQFNYPSQPIRGGKRGDATGEIGGILGGIMRNIGEGQVKEEQPS